MAFRKIKAGLVHGDTEQFVGEIGNLFFDITDGTLRLSDGVTPGGNIVSGGSGGSSYILPTASTTTKGGVKVDGTTITINNQVISATQQDLSSYATQTYVTTRGYLTTYTETDPVFTAWDKSTGISITESQISDLQNYLTTYTETDPVFAASDAAGITSTDIANWGSAYSWGNHADAGYLTSTDSIVKVADSFGVGLPFQANVVADATNGITISTLTGIPMFATTKRWKFDYDGNLTFPDDTVQTTAWNGTSLSSLSDVNIVGTPSDGHVLKYDAAAGHWSPAADLSGGGGGGGLALSDLDAVVDNTPSGNGSLVYNDTTGVFTYTPPDLSAYLTSVDANSLTGTTLKSTVVTSSLTSVGTLTGLTVGGTGGDLTMTGGAITGAGNITSSGTVAINAAGGITTTALAFDIVNSSATTVNIAGAATAVNIGAATGTLTLNNPTVVGTQTTQAVFDTVATTLTAFRAASTLTIGSTGGTMTLRNPTVVGTQTTVNLWNATSTTVNAFGAATAITIGATTGTTSIRNSLALTYAPATATGYAIVASGKDSQGGTGYFDILKATNTTSGVTNPNKSFRLSSDGQLQIINSAYTSNILNLTDAGNLSVPGTISVNYKQAVNGPAFSAYAAAILQTIPNNAQTKVLFQTEEFDTNSNYTDSRFTPTIEGYYQLNAEVRLDGASGTGEMMIILYKNGSEYKRGTNQSGTQIAANFWAMTVSSMAYANGSTDYFEIYVQQGSGGSVTVTAVNNSAITWFNGCMLRGA